MRHAAPRSRKKPAIGLFVSILIMGMGCGIAIAAADDSEKTTQNVVAQRDQAVAELEEAKEVARDIGAICAKGGAAAKVLGSACQQVKTVAEKPPVVIEIPSGDGLTEARARELVREELASQSLRMSTAVIQQVARAAASYVPKPLPGKDGKSVTTAEAVALVRAAVTLECANNRCDGAKGDTGNKGDQGAKGDGGERGAQGDGGPAGKDAPAVTEEQRRADLAAYCAQEAQPCRPNPFPFAFSFSLDTRTVTCTITAPSVVARCETVLADPSGDPPGGS